MPINYSIQADIVDIIADAPRADDVFLVDTNIWYWMTYPYATTSTPSQITDYPGYLNNALSVGAKIYHSGLSLAELAHSIEKTEREIYERRAGTIKAKEYRHNLPAERSRVVSQLEAAWGVVKSLGELLDATIEPTTVNASLVRYKTNLVDGYDLFILESMQKNGIVQIITDDGDYSSVPAIKVFTANKNVVAAARLQNRLIAR